MDWDLQRPFVFSSCFASMEKSAIAAVARRRGHRVAGRVSGVTQLVVLGERRPLCHPQHGIDLTTNTKRALLFRLQGRPIRVISESDFLAWIQGRDREPTVDRFHAADVVRHTGVTHMGLKKLERAGVLPSSDDYNLPEYDLFQLRQAIEFCRRFRRPSPMIDDRSEAIDRALVKLKGILPYAKQALETRRRAGTIGRRKGRSSAGQLFLDFGDDLTFPELTPLQIFEAAWDSEVNGDSPTAIIHYEELLARPDYHARNEVRYNLANNLYRLADYGAAAQAYRQVVQERPLFVEAWNNLGLCLAKVADSRTEAAEAFREALRLDPHFADVHFSLGRTLDQLGRSREAAEHWRAYLRYDKDSEYGDYALSRLREIRWSSAVAGPLRDGGPSLWPPSTGPGADGGHAMPKTIIPS